MSSAARAEDAAPPARESAPAPLSAAARGMWQTDQVVFALDYGSGVLYAGGSFTTVRPPDTALGDPQQVAQQYLAAFDSATGKLISAWRPQLNGIVFDLDVSADGSRLYAVGDFTTVDGISRSRIAAFDLADPRLPLLLGPEQFVASASARVYTVRAADQGIYIGGNFAAANGQPRTRVASFAANGSLLPFAPALAVTVGTKPLSVRSLAVGADRVFVGGMFDEVNGVASHGLDAVDPLSGASVPGFNTPPIVPESIVTTIELSDGLVYVAGRTDGGGGKSRLEGVMAMSATTGSVLWGADGERCFGDSFAIAVVLDTVWVGTHAHACPIPGGFPEVTPRRYFSVLGQNPRTGRLRHFFPDSSGRSSVPGSFYNVRAFATDGEQLFVGGGFTSIGDRTQQNLARFTAAAPTAQPEAAKLHVQPAPGRVLLEWQTTADRDDRVLTYRVFRLTDGTPPVEVGKRTKVSLDWQRRTVRLRDEDVQVGETITYVLEVSDRDHRVESPAQTVTIMP